MHALVILKKKTQIQTLYAWQRIWTGILLSPSPTYSCLCTLFFPYPMNQHPHSGQLWTQKWNSHLVRTQSLTLFHLTLSLPLGCHMRYVAKHAATGCWMLTFCVNSNFWYNLEQSWVLRMNISGLFNISFRLFLYENSISRVNGLAGEGLKSGVGQYRAVHAMLTARDFFLAYFYPSSPFTCILSKSLPISPLLAVANTWFLCRPKE